MLIKESLEKKIRGIKRSGFEEHMRDKAIDSMSKSNPS